MSCEIIRGEDGAVEMIVCSRGRRASRCQVPGCARPHTALCDWPLSGAKAGATCDLRLCDSHRRPQPGRDRDFCPAHAKMAAAAKGGAADGGADELFDRERQNRGRREPGGVG
jgi:hypothetical protein